MIKKYIKFFVSLIALIFIFSTVPQKTQAAPLSSSEKAAGGKWLHNSTGWWYRFPDGSYPRNTWQYLNGKWYHFDSRGYMQTGWIKPDGKYYYLSSSGAMLTGWQKIGNTWYYLNRSGVMLTGWQKINNTWYYLKSWGGMATGWQKIGNTWYYLKSWGGMATGWQKIGNTWYYLKSWGGMATGWVKDQGTYYFMNSSGAMTTGWQKVDNYWYYLKPWGGMATGWQTIGGKTYYLNTYGAMVSNCWISNYYLGPSGYMVPKEWMNSSDPQKASSIIYSSETLHIEIQRKTDYQAVFWTAHITTKNPDQLRSALSHDTYGGTRQRTSEAVPAHGGIIGVNGSAFDYGSGKPSPLGMCIKNGKIYGNYMTSYTVFATTDTGLMFTPPQGLMGEDLLKMGVKDTYNFGPILIQNGQPQMPIDVTRYKDPRTAVGMIKPGEYVILVADGRNSNGSKGLNHNELVREFQKFNCTYAYNLDGGGSATLYYNGHVLNHPSDGYERPCADYLFFTH